MVDILRDRKVRPPEFLHKYYAFTEWTPRIFQHNELYFPSPNAFNDPFDSVVRFICEGSRQQRKKAYRKHMPLLYPHWSRKEMLSHEREFTAGHWDDAFVRGMKKEFQKARDRMGVLCLTEERDNILMWSHYAKSHTGICLEFKTDDPFFSQVCPVDYIGVLPCVNPVIPDWNDTIEMGAKGLRTKALQWEYEHEWRIINLDRENGVGVHQFPPQVLHGVILGCWIASEDKSRVVEWCKARQPRPILYQAEQKGAEFGLDIVEVEY